MAKGIIISEYGIDDIDVIELDEPLFMSLGKAVGGFFEIVNINLETIKKARLIVNDCGAINGMTLNIRASRFYPYGGIYGPAIIMKEDFTEDGPDIVGLTDDELNALAFELMEKGLVNQ